MCASRSDPSSLYDLAPGAREDGRGQADELGELGAGLDDGTGSVGGVHRLEHDDQALVGGHADHAVQDVQELALVVASVREDTTPV
jgi:hypothetical protein